MANGDNFMQAIISKEEKEEEFNQSREDTLDIEHHTEEGSRSDTPQTQVKCQIDFQAGSLFDNTGFWKTITRDQYILSTVEG